MIRDVLVVGGGLAGLSTSIALAHAGLGVTLVDKRTAPPPDFWGFVLWPQALRALHWLGVGADVEARGQPLDALRFGRERGGDWVVVPTTPLRPIGRFVGIRPSTVVGLLDEAAQAAGVEIIRGFDLEEMALHSGHVEITGGDHRLRGRLLIACDGPRSGIRGRLGIEGRVFRVPGQAIVSGLGAEAEGTAMRQVLGRRWSLACVPLDGQKSWVAVNVHGLNAHEVAHRYQHLDPSTARPIAGWTNPITVRPGTLRLPRWADDHVMLVGDSAHAMVPHLGLGGSTTLADIPELVEVITGALRRRDLSRRALGAFRARRKDAVAYAQRVSDVWALASTGPWPGLRSLRDVQLRRLARDPARMGRYIGQLAGTRVPDRGLRWAVWLP